MWMAWRWWRRRKLIKLKKKTSWCTRLYRERKFTYVKKDSFNIIRCENFSPKRYEQEENEEFFSLFQVHSFPSHSTIQHRKWCIILSSYTITSENNICYNQGMWIWYNNFIQTSYHSLPGEILFFILFLWFQFVLLSTTPTHIRPML